MTACSACRVRRERGAATRPLAPRGSLGNVAVGVCLILVGVAYAAVSCGLGVLAGAFALLILSAASLCICLCGKRKQDDEMSIAHAGEASSFALKTTLIAVGLACAVGMATGIEVSLASAGCLIVGFALVTYGLAFGRLER